MYRIYVIWFLTRNNVSPFSKLWFIALVHLKYAVTLALCFLQPTQYLSEVPNPASVTQACTEPFVYNQKFYAN